MLPGYLHPETELDGCHQVLFVVGYLDPAPIESTDAAFLLAMDCPRM